VWPKGSMTWHNSSIVTLAFKFNMSLPLPDQVEILITPNVE
jgi:hypothetical protein